MSNKSQELFKAVCKMMDDEVRIIGFMEHYIDLIGSITKDITDTIDPTTLTQETKDKIALLEDMLGHSSVNFSDLSNPMEAYKMPKAKEMKAKTRKIQARYLKRRQDEGLL